MFGRFAQRWAGWPASAPRLTAGEPDMFEAKNGLLRAVLRTILDGREPVRPRRAAGGADIVHENDEVQEGHSVDALALRGDEGRGTLR
jgi:hypothetical protein